LEEARVELKRPASLLTDAGAGLLQAYHWPGNIRQLRNVMRRAALQSSGVAIEAVDLAPMLADENVCGEAALGTAGLGGAAALGPPTTRAPAESNGMSLPDIARIAVEEAEKRAIPQALRATRGHKQKAAQLLQTDYKTLFVKLKRYGLGGGWQAPP